MKTANFARIFVCSAGTLLMASALVVFISVWASSRLIHPIDPVFGVALPKLFIIIGGLEAFIALICFFGRRAALQVTLVLWLAATLGIYQSGVLRTDISGSLKGYFGDFSAAFGISASSADLMLKTLCLYLLLGSLVSLLWLWQHKESSQLHCGNLKTACTVCGGHISFSAKNLGQNIHCPHCRNVTPLCELEHLKMSCFFCKGHIEYPAHAIGEKIRCPHCKMDITLRNTHEFQA